MAIGAFEREPAGKHRHGFWQLRIGVSIALSDASWKRHFDYLHILCCC